MIRKFVALSLVAALAACSDSTGPENYDPVTTTTKAEAVLAALSGNPALASLAVLGPAMQLSAAAPAPALALAPFDPTDANVTTADRMRAYRDLLPSFGATGSLALFPVDLLGKTFAYDTDLSRYALDSTAAGAHATGVRFILYAVDPVLGQVLLPLNPVGYVDLIDVSSPSADAVQIVAVVNGTTYLDYTASAAQGTTSATISAQGYLSNGTDQVDFDLSLTATLSGASLDYQLTSSDGTIHLVATLGSNNTVNATLTLQGNGETIELTLGLGPSTISGAITYNGDVVVNVAGTPDSPTFTRPDGTALTQAEINALLAFGDIIGTLFDAFDNLLAPALVVFAIG
jgi:hypothetical protein